VGEASFYRSLKYFTAEMAFRRASWDDLRKAFEKYYPGDLAWFFDSVDRSDGTSGNPSRGDPDQAVGRPFDVAFTIVQRNKAYELDLPVTLYSSGGKSRRSFHLRAEKERFEMEVDRLPEKLVIDERLRSSKGALFGRVPPVIARLLGDEKPILVLPSSGEEIFERSSGPLRRKRQ